jgi:hypothetical protein
MAQLGANRTGFSRPPDGRTVGQILFATKSAATLRFLKFKVASLYFYSLTAQQTQSYFFSRRF